MARISVDPATVKAKGQEIETDRAQSYKAAFNDMYDAVGQLGENWKGKDNIAYKNQIEGFRDDLTKMYDLMVRYGTFLQQAADQYQATQDALEAEAKTLRN